MLKPRIISVARRATIHHDTRTAAQVDMHIHARKGSLGRAISERPIVRRSTAHIELGIVKHERALRMKHRPETPGT
jgi:hypothetical protein